MSSPTMLRAFRQGAHRVVSANKRSLCLRRGFLKERVELSSQVNNSRWFSAAPNFAFDEEESIADDEKRLLQAQEVRDELRSKTGRIWSDPWDLEEILSSRIDYDEMPEWSADKVSRISNERVQVYADKIPTLDALADMTLPPPPPPHPGEGSAKVYALQRKRAQYKYIFDKVSAKADTRIHTVQALSSWDEKQDAVDIMFEEIEFELKAEEHVLGKHPKFGTWVERALEEYLRNLQSESSSDLSTANQDSKAVPVFMDCFGQDDSPDQVVPNILHPLKESARDARGRMYEEWELSANAQSRRIMLRQCTRRIAKALIAEDDVARVYVHGRKGVGKTAALAATVACARKSGFIVLYLPDGDRLLKQGFFVEPNAKRPGVFDLPLLSQEVCNQMLASHETDLMSFSADKALLEELFTGDQLEKMKEYGPDTTPIVDLLKLGAEKQSLAATCYSIAVSVLMGQEEKPFLIVMDEFNCFFQPGQYFHAAYDEAVKKPIPYNQISLFSPVLNAMAVSAGDADSEASLMKKGGIVVGSSESRGVSRKITDALTASCKAKSQDETNSIHTIEVPRLSLLETEHMLANYEATGVGKIRLDRGETVMNDQEVKYLRAVSGGVAQELMDACIM